ncbi:MAG: hypothetical protein HRU76_09110 [Phycisphaeraceae bacterium]|nr:MAG: hypothetical protein HRU76_09110 [Phycisphaeraceae bacterium]
MEAERRVIESQRDPDSARSGAQGPREPVMSNLRRFGASVPSPALGLRLSQVHRPESAGFVPSPYLWRIAF